MGATWKSFVVPAALVAVLGLAGLDRAAASDWPLWRGPSQNGVSTETGLVSSWSPDGENLVWRADFTGRSTPVVFDGRVCASGRTGEGITKQETVACWDAGTGKKLWEKAFKVFHTTVPFTRVGWAEVAGDPETGNLYVHGVGGILMGLDRKGEILWSRSLTEEFGRFSGYGGRTHSPIVDEDRVILGMTSAAWGSHTAPKHRVYAFDRRTGELVWISDAAGRPMTMTTYSTPVVAVVNGRRLLIGGNSDGAVYALESRTGRMIWKFQLAKLGLNTSVAMEGDRVFVTTGDEPIDEAIMGRAVAIDATGSGDITSTHELWRVSGLKAKYASPLVHGGVVYLVDDSANLHALDAATGSERWEHSLGTVGRGSPVWADGKIFVTEVNGNFHILRPGEQSVEALDHDFLSVQTENGERYAEIYGSPAVAYGRVYLAAESGLYCLGDPKAKLRITPTKALELPPEGPATGDPATLLVVPADVMLRAGEPARFQVRAFDDKGRRLPDPKGATWSLDGYQGNLGADGSLTSGGPGTGLVVARIGDLSAAARVRVVPALPWEQDFSGIPEQKWPSYWVGAGNRYRVESLDGNPVLAKPFADQGVERQVAFMAGPEMAGYTIQADMRGTKKGRRMPDMGLVNQRYTLDLQGNHQRLEIRDWTEPRFDVRIDFPWEPDVWYRMKLKVEATPEVAKVFGKVWRADAPEPSEWTITGEDPLPNLEGSPGLYGYSSTTIYYDNVKVW